jgi:hypothetical protein
LKLTKYILAHKGIIGPLVRIWHEDGKNVRIGMQKGDKKLVLGAGSSFQDAFERIFVTPVKAREEAMEAAQAELAREGVKEITKLTEEAGGYAAEEAREGAT